MRVGSFRRSPARAVQLAALAVAALAAVFAFGVPSNSPAPILRGGMKLADGGGMCKVAAARPVRVVAGPQFEYCSRDTDAEDCFAPVLARIQNATEEQVFDHLRELLDELDDRQGPSDSQIIVPAWFTPARTVWLPGDVAGVEPAHFGYASDPTHPVGVRDRTVRWLRSANVIRAEDEFTVRLPLKGQSTTDAMLWENKRLLILDLGCAKIVLERYRTCENCKSQAEEELCCTSFCEEGKPYALPGTDPYYGTSVCGRFNLANHHWMEHPEIAHEQGQCPFARKTTATEDAPGAPGFKDGYTPIRHTWRLVQVLGKHYSSDAIRQGYEIERELAQTHATLNALETMRFLAKLAPGGGAADAFMRGWFLSDERSSASEGVISGTLDLLPGLGAFARSARLARLQQLGRLEPWAYAGIATVRIGQVGVDLRKEDYRSALAKGVEGVLVAILARHSFATVRATATRGEAFSKLFKDPGMAERVQTMTVAEIEATLRAAGLTDKTLDTAAAIKVLYDGVPPPRWLLEQSRADDIPQAFGERMYYHAVTQDASGSVAPVLCKVGEEGKVISRTQDDGVNFLSDKVWTGAPGTTIVFEARMPTSANLPAGMLPITPRSTSPDVIGHVGVYPQGQHFPLEYATRAMLLHKGCLTPIPGPAKDFLKHLRFSERIDADGYAEEVIELVTE